MPNLRRAHRASRAGIRASLLLIVVAVASGCASLHLRTDDSVGVTIAKVAGRIPVGVLTLGFSEVWHANERTMESWVGHHKSELLMAWGAPRAEYEDGAGGTILIYESVGSYTSSGSATTSFYGNTAYTTYNPPQTSHWKQVRSFRLDPNGKITGYSWRGM